MKFSAVLVAATALVAGVTADYATVKADVKEIAISVTKLADSLKATSGKSLGEAIGIHMAALALNDDITEANSDAKEVSSVNAAQAKALISILTKTYSDVTVATQRLIEIQPTWKKMGIAAIAKNDIDLIATSTRKFGATLVSKAPSSLKSSAKALASKYNAALASAAAAYAA